SKYRMVDKLTKEITFPQKTCSRLVEAWVERKNKSVPSVWVSCPISSIVHQNSQEIGMTMVVQAKKGISKCPQKISRKRSLLVLIITAFPPASLVVQKKNPMIPKCKNKIIQVL